MLQQKPRGKVEKGHEMKKSAAKTGLAFWKKCGNLQKSQQKGELLTIKTKTSSNSKRSKKG